MYLRRWQIFTIFDPYSRQFFTTIRRQIWPIFDPSPPKACRRLKWMVPNGIQISSQNAKVNEYADSCLMNETKLSSNR